MREIVIKIELPDAAGGDTGAPPLSPPGPPATHTRPPEAEALADDLAACRLSLADLRGRYVAIALGKTRGNACAAARLLGIKDETLRRYAREAGVRLNGPGRPARSAV